MRFLAKWLPVIVVVPAMVWLASRALAPKDQPGAMNIYAFGRLPVVFQGRIKPYDTLARNSLVVISDRQTYRDEAGEAQPAIRWLLDVITQSPSALKHKVFRIENLDLLETLGLEQRSGFRYALEEFQGKLHVMEEHAARAGSLPATERDLYDNKVLEFREKVWLQLRLMEAHSYPNIQPGSETIMEDLTRAIDRIQFLERSSVPHSVPPRDAEEEWKPFIRAVMEGMVIEKPNPATQSLARLFRAYREGDVAGFNGEVARYQAQLDQNPPAGTDKLDDEILYNRIQPFYHCAVLYLFAFLISVIGWLGWGNVLNRTAFWLLAATFLAHTLGLVARIYISGYPPVTTLYSSAIFIGWGCVMLGLILEMLYPIGVGNIVSAVTGFVTLLIAHFLSGDGDTFEMMRAVLDTKFWLATHVTTVTMGYVATFVAAGLSLLFILIGVLSRSMTRADEGVYGRMIYGVICFALLLSFVGTVLGGLWADDSWGRFWGWDPKENGALMIVLWNALILHARWGMVQTRGIAVLAVFGGIVTSWSWFGVNMLGVGLHSYGFMDSAAFWLVTFAVSQLAVMGLGLLPRSMWRSAAASRPRKSERAAPAAPDLPPRAAPKPAGS